MSYEDFCQNWTSLSCCRCFPSNKYLKQQFECEFSKESKTIGGFDNPMESPQFSLEVKEKSEFTISILQADPRRISNKIKNGKITFGIKIFNKKTRVMKKIKAIESNVNSGRECMISLNLDVGNYIILPFTPKKQETKFWLRIHSSVEFSTSQLYPEVDESNEIHKMNQEMNQKLLERFSKRHEIKQQESKDESDDEEIIDTKQSSSNEFKFKSTDSISSSDDNLTIKHVGDSNSARTVLTSSNMTEGRNLFQIEIEKTSNPSNIMIGVIDASEFKETKSFISYSKNGKGYYAFDGSKNENFSSKPYGVPLIEGDELGMIVDFNEKIINFQLNGKSFSTAFDQIKGKLTPAVTLYSPGDSVRIIENAEEKKKTEVGSIIKKDEKIFFKTTFGTFVTINEKGKLTTSDSISHHSIFTVSTNEKGFQFFGSNGKPFQFKKFSFFNFEEVSGNPNQFYLKNSKGKFLTFDHEKEIKFEKNPMKESILIVSSINAASEVLKEGESISFKTESGNFLSIKEDSLSSEKTLSKNSIFTTEKDDYLFKFKSENDVYLSFNEKTSFFVIDQLNGFSLSTVNGEYLDEKENIIGCSESSNSYSSIFYPEEPFNEKSIFKVGKQILLKSNFGDYCYRDSTGSIVFGDINPNCPFTIEKSGSLIRLKSNGKFLTVDNKNAFNVTMVDNGFTFENSNGFLAFTKNNIVKIAKKDNGKGTRIKVEIVGEEMKKIFQEMKSNDDFDEEEEEEIEEDENETFEE